MADALAFLGVLSILTGIYLLLGLPTALIAMGIVLLYVAVRLTQTAEEVNNEPDQETDTTI